MKQTDIFADEVAINRIVDLLMNCDLKKKQEISTWKKFPDEKPQDDDAVLVSWLKNKLIFYLLGLFICIPGLIYRFKHPELSETQLFLDFFKAYREFFW